MPFPLLIVLGVAAVVAAAGGAAIAAAFSDAHHSKIALLGPKKSGKTTWRTFLSEGVLPKGYEHTGIKVVVEEDLKLEDLKIKVEVSDMSGSDAAVDTWHAAAKRADHVFFFVDGTRLVEDRYAKMAQTYGRVIASWTDVKADVTLVVSHADQDPESDKDAIKTRSSVARLRQLCGARRILVADLGTTDGALEFTFEALVNLKPSE